MNDQRKNEIVSEVIRKTVFLVGYTSRIDNGAYAVIHEGRELGRIMVAPDPKGAFFSTSMPHINGVGEDYHPRPPESGFKPVAPDVVRFLTLTQMIHENILRRIEVEEMMESRDTAVTDTAGSDKWAYPPEKREEIAQCYYAARAAGSVDNKERWAQNEWGISGKTLGRYCREFPKNGVK